MNLLQNPGSLIATTALVATATVAAADVKFSGYGRFGAKYTEGAAAVAAVAPAITAAEAEALNELIATYNETYELVDGDDDFIADVAETAAADVDLQDLIDLQADINDIADIMAASAEGIAALKAVGVDTADDAAAGLVVDADGNVVFTEAEADQAADLAELLAAIAAAASGTPAAAAGSDEITAASRLRLQIDMSAASDNGLSFAARYRIQAEENAGNAANAARFTVSTGGLTIGAGNIGGAIEFMSGLYDGSASGGIGLEGNGFVSLATNVSGNYWNWDAYSSGGNGVANGVEVIYSAGGATVHVSTTKDSRTAAALSYSAGDLMVGVAMSDSDDNTEDKTLATVKYTMGASSVQLSYADNDGTAKTVLRGATSMGGMNVYGFVGDEDTAGVDTTYGIGVSYALGGGTSFEAGMTSNEAGLTTADAGFLFKF